MSDTALPTSASSSTADSVVTENVQQWSTDSMSSTHADTAATKPNVIQPSSGVANARRTHRKLSDGRKRSASNLFQKNSAPSATPAAGDPAHLGTARCSGFSKHPHQPPQSDDDDPAHFRRCPASSPSAPFATSTPRRHPFAWSASAPNSRSLRRQLLTRRSPSPSMIAPFGGVRRLLHTSTSLCPGYLQYEMSLLEVPMPRDYGDASSDDLSSEWDSDVPAEHMSPKPSGWRKLRNIVQWTPFFQTYKKQRYPWVQLAGHQGNFKAGPEPGTVLKKLCPKEELCFHVLMRDVLRTYVPEYKGQVTSDDGELYLQLQDLLSDFNQPCVMDCKIGVRTYLEEELSKAKEKPKLRKDMYEKMIQIDPLAPTDDEHKTKGVTKPRYMVWRETISSTATLGFRIEGIKKGDGTSSKDFKTTKTRDQIRDSFADFTDGFPHAIAKYAQRLRAIRATLECSEFFGTHEVIGSSLLFVHDRQQASIWLIDFAKTVVLPGDVRIDHQSAWSVGNHEDGYLIGIDNLISIFDEITESQTESAPQSSGSAVESPVQVRITDETTLPAPDADLAPSAQLSGIRLD